MTAHPLDLSLEYPTSPASTSPASHRSALGAMDTLSLSDSSSPFTLINASSALTATLACILQSRVTRNDMIPASPEHTMTVFHALEPPSISVSDYVTRVSKYVFCSEACLVAAYHYLNVVIRRNPNVALTSLTVHRLLITAVVLACKYYDDLSYNLDYYSKVGGLPSTELAHLEVNMLRMLDFRLDIPAHEFVAIEHNLIATVERMVGSPIPPLHPLNTLVAKAHVELVEADIISSEPTWVVVEPTKEDESAQRNSIKTTSKVMETSTEQDDVVVYRRPSGVYRKPFNCSPIASDSASETLSRNSSSNSISQSNGRPPLRPPQGQESTEDTVVEDGGDQIVAVTQSNSQGSSSARSSYARSNRRAQRLSYGNGLP